jgi:D-methionine transport system permease protein
VDHHASLTSLADLLLTATLETLGMVVSSTILAGVVGLVLGVSLTLTRPEGVLPRPFLHRLLGAAINVGRSVPFVILMVAIVPFTRLVAGTSIGTRAAVVPLVVAAIPYVARVVHASLEEVPQGLVEAIAAMGATPVQIIREAYLREARPALVRGMTLVAISLVSYSAMAGAVGGGGLGDLAVRYGYQRFRTDVMVATVIVLVVLVQALQAAGERLARRLDHR